MTSADIQRIRDAVPCQEFLQPITDMKPAGRERWVGACPFHADRTPSLSVHPTYFHCFGCGIGGDVFELARLVLGLRGHEATFRDAVRVLADFAGLPDPTVPPARYRVEVEP
jgi:DNA primase